jgi:hypothetical protein
MLLSVDRGRDHADIGIVNNDPKHPLDIRIVKIDGGGTTELKRLGEADVKPGQDLSLDVNNQARGGIDLFRPGWTPQLPHNGFDRKRPPGNNDSNDFRWVIDLESDEIYDDQITIDRHGFRSFFRINNIGSGLFFTPPTIDASSPSISEDELEMIDGATSTCLGPVALKIGANFPLDGGTALFTFQGNSIPLPPLASVTYAIDISQDCSTCSSGDNDSVLYDNAVTGAQHSARKIRFDFCQDALGLRRVKRSDIWLTLASVFGDPHLPEAVCFHATNSQTELR